jgi:hypothetical protein
MIKQRVLSYLIGVSQIVLGIAFLLVIDQFFSVFGFTQPSPDQKYLYGQLAARFIAYGIGMFYIARNLAQNRFWWDMMALIQAIDLAVGLIYTFAFGVSIAITGFPMFNAAIFLILLLVWRPPSTADSTQTS